MIIKLYFVTQSEKFGATMILSPRIPKSIDLENNEDNKIARICVCENITNCIKSILPNFFQGNYINIYIHVMLIKKKYINRQLNKYRM